MADWQPLSIARPDGPPPLPIAGASATCAECGRAFPPDELVTLNKSLVCAQCKPIFLQRMTEGVASFGQGGIWREGKRLFTRSQTPFPDRCVKCNAPANGFRLKQTLYWYHPAYFLLLLLICATSFIGLLVFIIVTMAVRKKVLLHIGLCEAHLKERTIGIIICTAGILGAIALYVVAAIKESWELVLVGTAALLFGIIWGIVKARTIVATKIDNDMVWVKGVGPAFLNDLPER